MVANLVNTPENVATGIDGIVIREHFEDLRGGKTLDTTGYTPDTIKAGHVIIRETATDRYKPMPVNATGDGYNALPGGHTYEGILVATIRTARPFASVMIRGTVNPKCTPYPMDTILAAFKTAQPLILWKED